MKKILLFSALLAIAFSCKKETAYTSDSAPAGLRQISIVAGSVDDAVDDDDTKVWAWKEKEGTYKFRWVTGDKVGVFDNVTTAVGGYEFSATKADGKGQATLTGSIDASATGPVVFLVPRQEWANRQPKGGSGPVYNTVYNAVDSTVTEIKIPYQFSLYEDGHLKFPDNPDKKDTYNSLDAESGRQLTRIGLYPDATELLSGINDKQINLYNPLSGICFTLSNCSSRNVTNIEIFGNHHEQLGGYCDIVMKDPTNPKVKFIPTAYKADTGQEVAYQLYLTYMGSDGIFVDGTYVTALAPANFTKGLTFKFTDNQGNIAFLTSDKALNLKRNHLQNLGTIDVDALDWYYGLDLRFFTATFVRYRANGQDGPFQEKVSTTKNTVNTQTFKLPNSSETVEFKTYCPSDNSDLGFFDAGFSLKGNGAYIEIPDIDGKVLKEIWVRVSAQSTVDGNNKNGSPAITNSDGLYLNTSGEFTSSVSEADTWPTATYGEHKSWRGNFEAGKTYRIVPTNQEVSMRIMNIVLLYDDAAVSSSLNSVKTAAWTPGNESATLMY